MAFRVAEGYLDIGSNFKSASSGLDRLGAKMAKIAVVAGLVTAAVKGLEFAVKKAAVQEAAVEKLRAALALTGDATEANMRRFQDLAASIQKLTTLGDEETLQQIAYAKSLGVSTDNLEKVTVAAIGLSKRIGVDLRTAMMLLARATKGQFQLFTRYGISLDAAASAQENLNTVIAFGMKGFSQAEAEATTLEGRWKQLKNAAGDVAEQIGEPLLKPLASAAEAMRDFLMSDNIVQFKTDAVDAITAITNSITGALSPALAEVASALKAILTDLETAAVDIVSNKLVGTRFGGKTTASGRSANSANRRAVQETIQDQLLLQQGEAVILAAGGGGKNAQDKAKKAIDNIAKAGDVLIETAKEEQRKIKIAEVNDPRGRFAQLPENERKLMDMIAALQEQSSTQNAFIGLDEAFRMFSTKQDNTSEQQLKVLEKQLQETQLGNEIAERMARQFAQNAPVVWTP